jgi:uncharacterized protein
MPRFAPLVMAVLLSATSALAASDCAPAAASFDCAKAMAPDELAICSTPALSAQDVRLATTYEILTRLVAMGQRGDMLDAQRAFLQARTACGGSVACISEAYRVRLVALDQALADLAARGPF